MTSKIAFVFPGQGSQSSEMLAKLFVSHPDILKPLFSKASEILNYDLKALIEEASDRLNQTIYTQPAMLITDLAYWYVYLHNNSARLPAILAGHSLGEYAALVAAKVFELETALKLVSERARLMQEAVPLGYGAMGVIIGLALENVQAICAKLSSDKHFVALANFNAPNQIVVAGHIAAVDAALEEAKASNARRAVKLPMSIPSHCELMRPMAEKFESFILNAPMHVPKILVMQNADNIAHEGIADIQKALIQQVYSPIRWVDAIHKMKDLSVSEIVECGPGKVLTGLNKRIESTIPCVALSEQLM